MDSPLQIEQTAHPNPDSDSTGGKLPCAEVRRYAVVALTNLTFGNASIKSYLCSYPTFVTIMVDQLKPAAKTGGKVLLCLALSYLVNSFG